MTSETNTIASPLLVPGRDHLRHKIASIVRIGYVPWLLLIDCGIAAIALLDIRRFSRATDGIQSLWYSFRLVRLWPIQKEAFLLVTLTLFLPIAIAIARIVAYKHSTLHGSSAVPLSNRWKIVHWLTAIVFCAFISWSDAMARLSGFQYDVQFNTFSYLFKPTFIVVLKANDLIWSTFSALGAFILAAICGLFWRRFQLAHWLLTFWSDVQIMDMAGPLYPYRYSPKRAHFLGSAVSPGIVYATKCANKLIRHCDRLTPGSTKAAKWLAEIAAQCSQLSRKLLVDPSMADGIHFSYTNGTSRALELCLSKWPEIDCVVLSPYEHLSERRVADWLSGRYAITAVECRHEYRWFHEDPMKCADAVSTAIIEALENAIRSNKFPALLISDICWANGINVPLEIILKEVRNHIGSRFKVVIDGAHGVGNAKIIQGCSYWDAYVFSGHKWLYSREPIGVIITKDAWKKPVPVDLWYEGDDGIAIPIGTTSGMAMCNFRGALEMIDKYGFTVMWKKSRELRTRLLKSLGSEFEILGISDSGTDTHSFIVGISPSDDKEFSDDLQRRLIDIGSLALVIRLKGKGKAFVRTTVPYYASLREISELRKLLCKSLK